ncbi:S28 family serine protease [Streptomyces sp. NPDC020801]|uniref:S28 family serine protease n=1 Tax=unclassified Streptomyces TaxID=2593676 RepID=UPI0037AB5075
MRHRRNRSNRTLVTWLLALVLLIPATAAGTAALAAAGPASAGQDIRVKLEAVPGMKVIGESRPESGYRFFQLTFQQPVDHAHPSAGVFQQRLTLLHKSESRPMVLFTTGYGVLPQPYRSEPTQLVNGNQLSVEERFFIPSRPSPADWSKLDIWQAASDHHSLVMALKKIYPNRWISTGGSKGGMATVYHRRFYPGDVDGSVAYVAPNDAVNDEDSAYDTFFQKVGTKKCRDALDNLEREGLLRRSRLVPRYAAEAKKQGLTFKLLGGPDQAYESVVAGVSWSFRQYHSETECGNIPSSSASDDAIYRSIDGISQFTAGTDQELDGFLPYYYQAGTQLGWPTYKQPHLRGLLRYPDVDVPRKLVPRSIPMRFQKDAMADVSNWVRDHGSRLLFVYGSDDPWGAEQFALGSGARDSEKFIARGANHSADISQLTPKDRATATADVQRWAGVGGPEAEVRTERIPALDSYKEGLERRPL